MNTVCFQPLMPYRHQATSCKEFLQAGIEISEGTRAKIQRLLPKIARREMADEIEWLPSGSNVIFKLKDHPHIVFKSASLYRGPEAARKKTSARFKNMIKAQEVCRVHKLSLLVIPHARKCTIDADGKRYSFIAEEQLDFTPHTGAQEEHYHVYSRELNETARQLAIFIAQTGFNDVTWRNVPILDEARGYCGARRIGLIDIEHMQNVVSGFVGDDNGSRGLLRCASSEEQIEIILAQMRSHGIDTGHRTIQEAKKRRCIELESDRQLVEFYRLKGITTGREPLRVDVHSLGLDDVEEQIDVFVQGPNGTTLQVKKTITLKMIAKAVVDQINVLIQKSPDGESVKGKRSVLLKTNSEPFLQYDTLGVTDELEEQDEVEKQRWPRRAIRALIDKGHIFELCDVNRYGYCIQA